MARRVFGLLTELQLRVLKYRLEGYSYREIAGFLGTSHQNVCVADKRARENISSALETVKAYHIVSSRIRVVVKEGTHLVDIPRLVIRECDRVGVKLRADFTYIYKLLRYSVWPCIKGTYVVKPILILVDWNGVVNIYPYDEVRDILEYIERIERNSL